MLNPSWRFRPIDETAAERIAAALGISPTLARLLTGRGLCDAASAERFLRPDMGRLHDPSLLPDIETAARRIAQAIATEELLLIHGDYDVDGVCSAALLTRGLKALGGNVAVHVPNRFNDGYDLQIAAVEEAHRNGIRLIVTTDCGIQAFSAVQRANELGIEVIVTDHHEPGATLPDAVAVVNPRRADSSYPFPAICGTTVAFKVLQATAREMRRSEEGLYRAFFDLVAIGTIGDMMPLVDENREIVRYGLSVLPQTKKVGLQALLASCPKNRDGTLSVEDVAFQIAPRINAVGRMEDPKIALELLLSTDFSRGRMLAQQMESVNLLRRKEQNRIFEQAQALLRGRDVNALKIIVLADADWHTGLIGPVASRIVETYRKPAILIAHDGEIGRGSARTAGGFRLMTALDGCRDLMERCGGHQQAAGFDLRVENLPAFEERLHALASDLPGSEDETDYLEIDAAIPPSELSLELLRELSALEPFGHGNASPLFASRFVVLGVRTMGKSSEHLKLTVRGEGMDPTEVVFWRKGAEIGQFIPGSEILLCYRMGINRFSGFETLQLEGVDAKPANEVILPYASSPSDPFASELVNLSH